MRWIASRFNAISHTDSGEVIIYNSYTGAVISVDEREKMEVLRVLRTGTDNEQSNVCQTLIQCGFLVPEQTDEKRRAQLLHASMHRTDVMHLIILPTEACNFRCTYCYQDFSRGQMKREIVEGLKRFLEQKMARLQHLTVSWFGGEPLLALSIIQEISEWIIALAERYGVTYEADISTNGYYLSKETLQQLLRYHVRRFMITIDGMKSVHDSRRFLANGQGTYDTIMQHLRDIRTLDESFDIYLRLNFDKTNIAHVPSFLTDLAHEFAGDARFQLFCRPVGKWGGTNDDHLPICDDRTAERKIWELTEQGVNQGLSMSKVIESMLMPGGAVCYAAKPHSLVIGTDGQLYKCTCFLNESYNHVGQLHEDGTIQIDYDRFALWVTSGEEQDEACQSCFFRPTCQGNHCPQYRIRKGKRPCPYEKRKIKQVLQLIYRQEKEVIE